MFNYNMSFSEQLLDVFDKIKVEKLKTEELDNSTKIKEIHQKEEQDKDIEKHMFTEEDITQIRLEYDHERKIIKEKSIKDFLSKVDKFTSNTYKDDFVQWLNENRLMLSVDYTFSSINQLKDVFENTSNMKV